MLYRSVFGEKMATSFTRLKISPVWFWSGSQKSESREVLIETIHDDEISSMRFKTSKLARGDVAKMLKQINIPEDCLTGYELRLLLHSHYHNPDHIGRIQYEVHLDGEKILSEDVALWNHPNLVSISSSKIPIDRKLNIHIVLKCIGNCEDWDWGRNSKIELRSVEIANCSKMPEIDVVSTSPFSVSQNNSWKPPQQHLLSELMHNRRIATKDKIPEWKLLSVLNDKLKSYSLIDKLGIIRPALFGIFDSIHNVPMESLPEEFVLKPYHGDNNWGVFSITKAGEKYHDGMRNIIFTHEELVKTYEDEKTRSPTMSSTCFCEQVVKEISETFSIPVDYKFYCFDGKVKLLLIRDLNGGADITQRRYRFFDEQFELVDGISNDLTDSDSIILPENISELAEVAEKISASVPLPFIRVDLFNSVEGVIFGEFTVDCGLVDKYNPTWDKILGEAYVEAQKNLSAKIPNLSKYIEESGLLSLGMPTILDASESD